MNEHELPADLTPANQAPPPPLAEQPTIRQPDERKSKYPPGKGIRPNKRRVRPKPMPANALEKIADEAGKTDQTPPTVKLKSVGAAVNPYVTTTSAISATIPVQVKQPRQWHPGARDLSIYKDYVTGKGTIFVLAELYGLTFSSVGQILRKVESWLAQNTLINIQGVRCQATQRLEFIYSEAVTAWEKSKADEVTITDKVDDHIETRKGQTGNPAYLAQARESLDMILKIWGAYAPKKLDISDTTEDAQRVGGRSPLEALQLRANLIQERIEQLVDGNTVDAEGVEEHEDDEGSEGGLT